MNRRQKSRMDEQVGFRDMALQGQLSGNLTGFCRLLRQQGAGVGPGEQMDALTALQNIDLGSPEAFRSALRTTLAKSHEEQSLFDEMYDHYWKVWDRAGELTRKGREVEKSVREKPASEGGRTATVTISDWLRETETTELDEESAGYSPFEVDTHRDFKEFSGEEIPAIVKLINELSRALATRFSRRYSASRRGKLDLRRTLRLSLRRGGELVDLSFKRRKRQRLKLVLLYDVSKSMDLYSRFLLQFIFAFQTAYRRIETFAFSTSLHRTTKMLKADNLEEALDEISRQVPDWSGGTKIGRCLRQFVDDYAALIDRNTVILIVSDGWDTGEIDVLREAMEKIQRGARCLIWLNPLMGNPNYAPSCRGMQAALPFVDIMASAHNVDSLRTLVRKLGKLQMGEFKFTQPWSSRAPTQEVPSTPEPERPVKRIGRAAWLRRFGVLADPTEASADPLLGSG